MGLSFPKRGLGFPSVQPAFAGGFDWGGQLGEFLAQCSGGLVALAGVFFAGFKDDPVEFEQEGDFGVGGGGGGEFGEAAAVEAGGGFVDDFAEAEDVSAWGAGAP